MKLPRKFTRLLQSTRGSVESALIVIPLLALFLIGMQLASIAHTRNQTRSITQNEASVRAISGEFDALDEFVHIDSSSDDQNLDLVVVHREAELQKMLSDGSLLGLMSINSRVALDGIAVVENRR